ncbi:MAG: PAS domain-containing sensor histidine kinase [Nitrospirota bacterium]|nr:PAS domain-containing sensor histidine kinase [Nitrospirota bacterium]
MKKMDTYFAPAERANEKELIEEIETVNRNPVMSGLLHSISGLLAILDEHRQIITLNDSFLKMLGIKDPAEALGLRTGEALQCIHAQDEPAGCGTTKFCSTCGAAIAIVSSLSQDKPVERICALTANRGGRTVDIALLVRSHPINISGTRFLLLFLQDISIQQQRAALERTFFHDVNNMLTGLVGASEMLSLEDNKENLIKIIHQSSLRLKKEVEIQRSLSQSETYTYHPLIHETSTGQILEELQSFFVNHPVARNKNLQFPTSYPALSINTDMSLLLRVLYNMLTNALESAGENGTVKVWLDHNDNLLSFYVWNRQLIPQDIAQRVFQRNFTTKEGAGRGIGTYSMKLFGEQILGGQVSFTTSEEEGTVFTFSVPL